MDTGLIMFDNNGAWIYIIYNYVEMLILCLTKLQDTLAKYLNNELTVFQTKTSCVLKKLV